MDQSLVRPVMTCGTPVAFAAQFICLPRHLHFDISAGSLKCSVQTYCSAVPGTCDMYFWLKCFTSGLQFALCAESTGLGLDVMMM